jgi:hypothetical protein
MQQCILLVWQLLFQRSKNIQIPLITELQRTRRFPTLNRHFYISRQFRVTLNFPLLKNLHVFYLASDLTQHEHSLFYVHFGAQHKVLQAGGPMQRDFRLYFFWGGRLHVQRIV